MNAGLEIVFNRGIHTEVIENAVLHARHTVWIATADLKDMHVKAGRRYTPILELFESMAARGVHFRVIHAKLPSGPFRETLESLPNLLGGALELQICPRSHWKMVLVDGEFGYFGSANFTGAGLGVKNADRRNLEVGAVTRDPAAVKTLVDQFDAFWMGNFCRTCAFRESCPDPIG